jgi:peptidylprolyl isomerase
MKATSLVLVTLMTAIGTAQTAPTKRSTTSATNHTTASPAPTAAQAIGSADAPPNIPKLEGTPKTLYALRYIDIEPGTGDLAVPRRYYTVHYTGWLTDGTKFDSSVDRGEPITFPYGARQVIAGWDSGFEGMRIGGKRRLFVPWQLAYGASGRPPMIPPKADLIFDVELIGQSETDPRYAPPAQPASPPQSAAPPTTAAPSTPARPATGDANQQTSPSAPQTPHP